MIVLPPNTPYITAAPGPRPRPARRPPPPPESFMRLVEAELAARRQATAPGTLIRAEFDKLDALSKARHIRAGGRVIDR